MCSINSDLKFLDFTVKSFLMKLFKSSKNYKWMYAFFAFQLPRKVFQNKKDNFIVMFGDIQLSVQTFICLCVKW